MDFYGMEACIDLPAFQADVINQVIRPQQLDLHLERRERTIMCPHCETCCSRVKESRTRGLRDWPMLERPVMLWLPLRRFACRACPHRPWETRATFGERVKWTERLDPQVRSRHRPGSWGQAGRGCACCGVTLGATTARQRRRESPQETAQTLAEVRRSTQR